MAKVRIGLLLPVYLWPLPSAIYVKHHPAADVQLLNVARSEAEGLVVSLILDGKIKGRIDQVNGLLVLDRLCVLPSNLILLMELGLGSRNKQLTASNALSTKRYQALDQLSKELEHLGGNIVADKLVREGSRGWGGAVPAL